MAAHISRRLRQGATTTAVAAVAMAALTASQAPGFAGGHQEKDTDAASETLSPSGGPISGDSSYHTDLPPLKNPAKSANPSAPPGANKPGAMGGDANSGIPATVLDAYQRAESAVEGSTPGCQLPWELLASIGRVESGQARGGAVDREGTTLSPILGPVLNGNGFAKITDTDGGAYDDDVTHDRAVGPMQFIPSTWAIYGQDGNGDGERNPNNIYDAALAAANYLCANDRDLSVKADLDRAILGYNRSQEYLRTVLSWFEFYRNGTHEVPDGTGVLPVGGGSGTGGNRDKSRDNGADAFKEHGKGKPGKTTGGQQQPGGHTQRPAPPNQPQQPKPPHTPDTPGPGTPPPTQVPTHPPTTPPPTTTPPKPTPTPDKRLTHIGARQLTATEGEAFAESPQARVEDTKGKPLSGVRVRFEIHGETEARFYGLTDTVTVFSRQDGTAQAPKLIAGKQAGAFTVRATIVGESKSAIDFTATVKARPVPTPTPDALAPTQTKPLTAKPSASYAEPIVVQATRQGKPAANVKITATMITSAADNATQNDKGPYFKDAKGKPLRLLSDLTTDANGRLTLPKIYTDGNTGTFLLRLTTANGLTSTLTLTVG
ncbi:lytic murein transglycosylase [Streptomyces zagrosensis]|uniref:Membrane-bound lytic murein transglycosylase B n=1 Tax=Streptomyces zagrosensis TaxID=1042984 RepID=A0A7W9Q4P9_9ACTN|nr:lytic murein transglycosylase [Streptomyces zagrosensis]MBB5933578.1 membrane-bound lytic murein transglycosylase B [Streptomyces zagrosensis]